MTGEEDKHGKNNIPCTERGWVCVPWLWRYLVVGETRHKKLSQGLPRNQPPGQPDHEVLTSIHCHLNWHYTDVPEC